MVYKQFNIESIDSQPAMIPIGKYAHCRTAVHIYCKEYMLNI